MYIEHGPGRPSPEWIKQYCEQFWRRTSEFHSTEILMFSLSMLWQLWPIEPLKLGKNIWNITRTSRKGTYHAVRQCTTVCCTELAQAAFPLTQLHYVVGRDLFVPGDHWLHFRDHPSLCGQGFDWEKQKVIDLFGTASEQQIHFEPDLLVACHILCLKHLSL